MLFLQYLHPAEYLLISFSGHHQLASAFQILWKDLSQQIKALSCQHPAYTSEHWRASGFRQSVLLLNSELVLRFPLHTVPVIGRLYERIAGRGCSPRNTIQDSMDLMAGNNFRQRACSVRSCQLPGIGRADCCEPVCGLNGSLHQIDASFQLHGTFRKEYSG